MVSFGRIDQQPIDHKEQVFDGPQYRQAFQLIDAADKAGNDLGQLIAFNQVNGALDIYDFLSLAQGKAIPYGIYDIGHNQGYVVVGTSHDTAEFTVAAIRSWWLNLGQGLYPGQIHLLIPADGGGSNGNRPRLWRVKLQQLADEFGLIITVNPYPPGASKWNLVEHRMFNLISANWAGHPLDSYETILNYIQTTTSTTGFSCQAELDTTVYETGITVPVEALDQLCLGPHRRFPKWNYTIYPRSNNYVK